MEYKIRRVTDGAELVRRFDDAMKAGKDTADIGAVDKYPWGCAYRPCVRFMLGRNDAATYVAMRCYEENPRVVATEENGAVYRDSCMEFFVSLGEGAGYINFEMNAAGVLLLHHGIDSENRSVAKRDPGELCGTGSDRHVQAMRGAEDCGAWWQLLLTVPHKTLARLSFDRDEFVPVPGTVIRANLYKCGDDTGGLHYGCYFPIDTDAIKRPNFHVPEYFGKMVYI